MTTPLPVTLDANGSVLFEGTVSGSLQSPLVAGQLRALRARWEKVQVDALSSTVLASEDKLTLTRFSVTQNGATATGNGTIALRDWKASGASEIDIHAEGRNLNVGDLRQQAGLPNRSRVCCMPPRMWREQWTIRAGMCKSTGSGQVMGMSMSIASALRCIMSRAN